MEPFVLNATSKGVNEWQNDGQTGFVYRSAKTDFVLTLGNDTGQTQDRTDVSFDVQDMDGEGDLTVDGDGWTCEGEREIACTSQATVAPGGTWPALQLTMRHTKGGQTEVTTTWRDQPKSVIFRYDTST